MLVLCYWYHTTHSTSLASTDGTVVVGSLDVEVRAWNGMEAGMGWKLEVEFDSPRNLPSRQRYLALYYGLHVLYHRHHTAYLLQRFRVWSLRQLASIDNPQRTTW